MGETFPLSSKYLENSAFKALYLAKSLALPEDLMTRGNYFGIWKNYNYIDLFLLSIYFKKRQLKPRFKEYFN